MKWIVLHSNNEIELERFKYKVCQSINESYPECKVHEYDDLETLIQNINNYSGAPKIIACDTQIPLGNQTGRKIVILSKGMEYTIVNMVDIVYVERVLRKTYIHTDSTMIETTERLEKIFQMLNKEEFVRCHNSFIIGFNHIVTYKRNKFIMKKEGREINISRQYQQEVREKFNDWMMKINKTFRYEN